MSVPHLTDAPSCATTSSTGGNEPDALIRALAARQHGVVSRAQLRQAGVPVHYFEYRLKKGSFEAIHPGVYQVGPIAAPYRREMAAVLAYGRDVVLSHQSAGSLWDLLPPTPATAPVTISTVRDVRGRYQGVQLYRVMMLGADETTSLDGLPLTTPARTIFDLAGRLDGRGLEQVLARADRKDLLDRVQLEQLLERYPRRRGRARLRTLLATTSSPAFTRSEAEERFLDLIRSAGLRPPETNAIVRGFEVDAVWRAERLVVEIDGLAYHSTPDRLRPPPVPPTFLACRRPINQRPLTQQAPTR